MTDKKAAIILAAGKGKRMKSDLPKVLHSINGRPMITILLDTFGKLQFEKIIVVIGYKGEEVEKALADYSVAFAWQHEQLGTGHAVKMASDQLADFDGTTVVANGDMPFLSERSLERMIKIHSESGSVATCLSAEFDNPTGYGRIIRVGDSDRLKEIIEEKDASEEIKLIREINSGTFCFNNKQLFETLDLIGNENAQQEYYLTDAIKILHDKGLLVSVALSYDSDEAIGVNSVEQLEELSRKFKIQAK